MARIPNFLLPVKKIHPYKTNIIFRIVLLVPILLFTIRVYAGELVTDLNGFRLQQFRTVPDIVLGTPFKTLETEDREVRAYQIDDQAYMVFTYDKRRPYNINSIQLTGNTRRALPFKGLCLGDSREKVEQVLGKPSRMEDTDLPNISALKYDDRNYLVEVDDQQCLYSIKVFTTTDMMSKTEGLETEWLDFKAAILARDISKVAEMLRPDIEIYKDGKILSITQKFSDFIENPDKDFQAALFGEKDSIFIELVQSEPEEEIRVVIDFGVGLVYKFYQGKIIKEIVFFPYNGRYRVYEIAFRDKSGEKDNVQNPGD